MLYHISSIVAEWNKQNWKVMANTNDLDFTEPPESATELPATTSLDMDDIWTASCDVISWQ